MQSFFISSTFRDMQGERDALHRTVMPRVRALAKEYGQSVQFVDLRWGISTEDMEQSDAQEKILEVCLREIDACRPYMIVLLGERYGWLPGAEVIGRAASGAGFAPDPAEISVTELEIQYGIWRNNGMLSRCIFCFREPLETDGMPEDLRTVYGAGSADDKRRMEALKEKIAANPSAEIFRYRLYTDKDGTPCGYEEYAEGLSGRLLDMLRRQWGAPRKLSWLEQQLMDDRMTAENLTSGFVGLEEERSRYAKAIVRSDLTVLEGAGGSGKSAMMAKLAEDLGKKYRTEIIFCGTGGGSMYTDQLLKNLTWRLMGRPPQLTEQFSKEQTGENITADRKRWNEACRIYGNNPVVLFIDAIDQLVPDDALLQSWFIPAEFPQNLRIVVSTTGAVGINRMLLGQQTGGKKLIYRHLTLESPAEAERRKIAAAQFGQEHKQVSEPVLSAILAHPLSQNMLCLNMMVRWLSSLGQKDFRRIAEFEQTMDGASAIETYLLLQIGEMPKAKDRFINAYIDRVMHFLSPTDSEGTREFARSILPLYFISMTSHGLSREQLEQIQQKVRNTLTDKDHVLWSFWNEADFSRMCAYMGSLLVEREDGRVDIAHRLIREALRTNSIVRNYTVVLVNLLVSSEADNVTRQEDLIPLIMQSDTFDWDKMDRMAKRSAGSRAHACLQDVISDAGNLKESDDPEEAARGKARWENLVRIAAEDLMSGSSRERGQKIELLCEALSDAAEKGETHFYWLFSFYIHDVSKNLASRGMQEKADACRIIATALRKVYDKGKEDGFAGWSDLRKKRHLLWQQYAVQLMQETAGAIAKRRVRWDNPPEITEGLTEAFEDYERRILVWLPEDPRALYRLGMLQAYRALLSARSGRREAKTHAEQGEDYFDRMIRCSGNIDPQTLASFYGFGMSALAKFWSLLGHDAVLRTKQNYRTAEGIMEKAFAFVQTSDGTRIADHLTWLRMTWCMCVILAGLGRDQDAVELLWKAYKEFESPVPPLNQRERKELSEVGFRLGNMINYGFAPHEFYNEANGETVHTGRSRLYKIILHREEDYLNSALENDITYRYKMMHLKQFRYMITPKTDHEESLRLLDEIAADCREIRSKLDGTEEFNSLDLDMFGKFLKKLRESLLQTAQMKNP